MVSPEGGSPACRGDTVDKRINSGSKDRDIGRIAKTPSEWYFREDRTELL